MWWLELMINRHIYIIKKKGTCCICSSSMCDRKKYRSRWTRCGGWVDSPEFRLLFTPTMMIWEIFVFIRKDQWNEEGMERIKRGERRRWVLGNKKRIQLSTLLHVSWDHPSPRHLPPSLAQARRDISYHSALDIFIGASKISNLFSFFLTLFCSPLHYIINNY